MNFLFFCIIVKPWIKNRDEFRNIVIKKNQQFQLDVKFAGEPQPTVTWKKDDREVIPDNEERLVVSNDLFILLFKLLLFMFTFYISFKKTNNLSIMYNSQMEDQILNLKNLNLKFNKHSIDYAFKNLFRAGIQ